MDAQIVTDLLAEIITSTGSPQPTRQPMRVWAMSGVERLTFPDGTTAIYKYATEPFASEDRILRAARRANIPVPKVYGAIVQDDVLGMVIEDLGEETRAATDTDGLVAAVTLHEGPAEPLLPVLDEDGLAALPERALGHLRRLREADRWTAQTDDVTRALEGLAQVAAKRAEGAHAAPFGWVHSEFHPTSLHLGSQGWRLLDFARAFTGPGLLDLASWHGTIDEADPVRLRRFIEAYVEAGGHSEALTERGGLTPERWALGWHRVWVVEWFLEQAIRWINNPEQDPAYLKAVRRHVQTAVTLLEA